MKPKNAEELIAMLDDLELKAKRNEMTWEICVDKKAELINQYASLREKETAIEFIKWYDANDGVDWIDDSEYLEWYTEYTKHKEG